MNRVIVIGSNSFSGTHFVRHALEAGMDVLGISRSLEPDAPFLPYRWDGATGHEGRFEFRKLDLNGDMESIQTAVREFRAAYVVNFAAQSMVAQSWEHPEHWYQTNVLANVCLHEGLRTISSLRKYVHISTPEVYGSCSGNVVESTDYNPSTPYATSRAACDMHLMNYYDNYDFPVVFTRAANVYGPGQQLYRIIPRAIISSRLGQQLPLHGGGTSVRSFIHIDDVVDGTLRVMRDAEPPAIYHLATERYVSIRELVELICDRLDVEFSTLVESAEERPGKDAAYVLDSTRARQELGWSDRVDLERGIDQTIEWVDRYLSDLKGLPMEYNHKQ